MLTDEILKHKSYVIYGAQVIVVGAREAIKHLTGIEHYRRHLLVKPEMLIDDIDAIMPLPYICYPNEMAQFLRFTTEDVKDAMFKALEEGVFGESEGA